MSLKRYSEFMYVLMPKKAFKDSKFQFWFRQNPKLNTRQYEYYQPIARTERLKQGPISYLTRLLNKNKKK